MAATVTGLVQVFSSYAHAVTVARVLASLARHGMPLAARIDHATAALEVGLSLPPTELLIFGNPRAGTPLMLASPTIALDLPLKLLVSDAANDRSWVSYIDPAWLAQRHHLSPASNPIIRAMGDLLATIVREATARERS